MAVRSGVPVKSVGTQLQEMGKTLNRLYAFWIAGLAIGVLGLQPASVSMAGLSINIARPEAIQGILYFIVLGQSAVFFINEPKRLLTNRAWLRAMIHNALSKGRRSLQAYTAAQRPQLHRQVRAASWLIRGMFLLFAGIPAVSILIFSREALSATVAALVK